MSEPMNNEPGTKPNPDPTVATNDAVERAMKSERDYVDGRYDVLDERLRGIDKATDLRLGALPAVTGEIDTKVEHLAELTDTRIRAIEQQLAVAESQRVEQKADSKTGLDAALAAQKEAASEQNKSNTLAIGKSETATSESIKKLEDLFTTKTDALADKVEDLKGRVNGSDAVRQGQTLSRTEGRAATSTTTAIVAAIVGALVLFLLAVQTFRHPARTPITVVVTTQTTP